MYVYPPCTLYSYIQNFIIGHLYGMYVYSMYFFTFHFLKYYTYTAWLWFEHNYFSYWLFNLVIRNEYRELDAGEAYVLFQLHIIHVCICGLQYLKILYDRTTYVLLDLSKVEIETKRGISRLEICPNVSRGVYFY